VDDADAPAGGLADAAEQEQVFNSLPQQPPSTESSEVSRGAALATEAAAATVAAAASGTALAEDANGAKPTEADRARHGRRLSHADWSAPATDRSPPPVTGTTPKSRHPPPPPVAPRRPL